MLNMFKLIKQIESIIESSTKLTVDEFVKKLKNILDAHNYKGYSKISIVDGVRSGVKDINIETVSNKRYKHERTLRNDPAYHRFVIRITDDDSLPDEITVSTVNGTAFIVKLDKYNNKLIRVKWDNKTGTPQQILKHMESYYKRLEKKIAENRDRLAYM